MNNGTDQTTTNPLSSVIPWYKQRAGKVFLGVLGILALGFALFGLLIGYYFIQIKLGNVDLRPIANPNTSLTLDSRQSGSDSVFITGHARDYIRNYSPTFGKDDAPITILAFIDFECPFCQAAYPVFKSVVAQYGPAVQVVFKHFPIATIHPNSERAALAAMCAEEQNLFWPYYDSLFEKKRFSQSALVESAGELGMDTLRFTECLETKRYANTIETDFEDVRALGVRGTPTYIVNRQKLEGAIERADWDRVIIEELSNINNQ